MKSKKITYIALGILISSVNLSCEKWLDVQPKTQIKANELFETEAGFKEALAGIYTIMTDRALYGREMTYGMMGVLSHEWTGFSPSYNDDATYNYLSSLSRGRIDAVWSNMYKAISNANMLLDNIDNNNVFTGNNYTIIKGEALALRAFLHFDLVRCFGLSYAVNSSQASIPYVTLYTSNQTKQHTVDEIVNKAMEDLILAKELLKTDPIYTGRTINEIDDNGYLINRQVHMNYYAVKALLARIYLYKGDYVNARLEAQSVVDVQKFPFSSQQHVSDLVDLSGAPEHIFALQINDLHQRSIDHLTSQGTGPIFSLSSTVADNYFGADIKSNDYRYIYLLADGTGGNATQKYSLKYSEPAEVQGITNPEYYREKIPLIKISEMYFILAECDNNDGIDPLTNINKVRTAKGIFALTTLDNFRSLMTSEFRKEFLAEGQLFFYYKRINQELIANTDANLITSQGYTFPLPDAEFEAANRVPNR
ncbi:RagB/SusD family nutrient uptake outer membrane protein [Sphingobacterium alkalisoli]|uniref:RagB/SusD family nutrient uptake outer membrane protein n=1 Tax=Sphingobacterium alkalisoli TaxID=1874115 RepID=A0A4V5LXY1_9SPHI|nr:RagB/SusD family nutrient uptake outer membrane protein [Sphingobacterium alkalisoli]TJY64369.1 RagB/SusD family nutrient uptake outer membrane protein [Sphingobacterium alkalisoli]GGH22165.1 hypothetical protein GCM10011418_28540 [Sphingobacterium alkalisoli]